MTPILPPPPRASLLRVLTLALICILPAAAADFPSDAIPQPRQDQYADLAVRWMQDYLRVDTTNPPGN
ncbi:MAG: hypothetical protein ACRD2Y_16680, partial [Terriglobales bacterium]